MLETGICEASFSKRTIIGFMAGVKERVSDPVYVINGEAISRFNFTGVTNKDGCVLLNGSEVRGINLLEMLNEHKPEGSFSETMKPLLEALQITARAGAVVNSRTGSYPPLFLNGIYVDFESKSLSFMPASLIKFMASYLDAEIQKYIRFAPGESGDSKNIGEFAFVRDLAKLLYLFAAKPHLTREEEPFYYLADILKGSPKLLADVVWDATHGRNVSLQRFVEALENAQQNAAQDAERDSKNHIAAAQPLRPPLFRGRRFIRFSRRLSAILSRRLKLIIIILVSLGFILYLLMDFMVKSRKPVPTAGLNPEQVVRLYYSAYREFDLDVVESIFYRRAGKEVMNELSALFVMSKLESLYQRPETLQTGPVRIIDIEDLAINKVENDQNPVFETRYKKTINTVDRKSEYSVREILTLGEIDGRWYVIKISRESTE